VLSVGGLKGGVAADERQYLHSFRIKLDQVIAKFHIIMIEKALALTTGNNYAQAHSVIINGFTYITFTLNNFVSC